jgi:hypothetical protein
MRGTLAERLWARVDTNGPVVRPELGACWLWTGAVRRGGYGQIGDGKRCRSTHVVAWELAVGPVPELLCVLHQCDQRRCVRPSHLFLGTRKDNAVDCKDKGRNCRGERHGAARLTPLRVLWLRARAAEGVPIRQLAARLRVPYATAFYAAKGTNWKHLPGASA